MTAGPPFRISAFDGRQIAYQGIGFDGSPREVFWGRYIEPFLEDLCVTELRAAITMARDRSVVARDALPEIQGLLLSGMHKVYERMAEIDQRLRGKGYPHKIARRDTDNEIAAMKRFLSSHVEAELRMWKTKSRLEAWYEHNKALAWIVTLAVGAAVALASKLL